MRRGGPFGLRSSDFFRISDFELRISDLTWPKAVRHMIGRPRILDAQWAPAALKARRKRDPERLALAARRRRETTLTIKVIANRLHFGSWKSATTRLQKRQTEAEQP